MKSIFCLLFVTFGMSGYSQISINADGSLPDNSAMLDVKSTAKGLLIPRMTQAQRTAIPSPAAGLMIYQTDNTPGLYYNSGSPATPAWSTLGNSGSQWQSDGNNIYYLNGNIGIGESSPAGKLHVSVPGDWAGITFTGTGLNDASVNSSGYSGTGATNYAVRIANAGPNPNLIEYSSNGGTSWSAQTPITANLNVGNGVLINFAQTSGHTFNDQWTFTVNQSFKNTLVVMNDKVGIGTNNPTKKLQVNNGDGMINGINIGRGGGSVTTNSAFGSDALNYNTSGYYNVANGYGALLYNSTGFCNVANGAGTLFVNTTGFSNTAIGSHALHWNTTGYQNTALGDSSLYENEIGRSNTATGSFALQNNTSDNNTADGAGSLQNNTTGYGNAAFGLQSLFTNTIGVHNTGLGEFAYFDNADLNNTTCVGFLSGGVVEANNRVEIGNASVSVIAGQVGFSTYSDERIKDNIQDDVPGLAFINKLRPVTYNLNIHRENAMLLKGTNKDEADWEGKYDIEKIRMTGFVAQDVEKAAKESGYDFSGVQKPANPDELYSLRYSEFVVPMVKAVQELNQKNEALEKMNQELLKRIEKLENK